MKLFNIPRRCTLCRHRAKTSSRPNAAATPMYTVSCPDCGRHTWDFGTRQLAVKAWNSMG